MQESPADGHPALRRGDAQRRMMISVEQQVLLLATSQHDEAQPEPARIMPMPATCNVSAAPVDGRSGVGGGGGVQMSTSSPSMMSMQGSFGGGGGGGGRVVVSPGAVVVVSSGTVVVVSSGTVVVVSSGTVVVVSSGTVVVVSSGTVVVVSATVVVVSATSRGLLRNSRGRFRNGRRGLRNSRGRLDWDTAERIVRNDDGDRLWRIGLQRHIDLVARSFVRGERRDFLAGLAALRPFHNEESSRLELRAADIDDLHRNFRPSRRGRGSRGARGRARRGGRRRLRLVAEAVVRHRPCRTGDRP